jgi:hypothetical protein
LRRQNPFFIASTAFFHQQNRMANRKDHRKGEIDLAAE